MIGGGRDGAAMTAPSVLNTAVCVYTIGDSLPVVVRGRSNWDTFDYLADAEKFNDIRAL